MESEIANPSENRPLDQAERRESLRRLAEIADVPLPRLRSWIRAGLIPISRAEESGGFTFQQVQTASALAKLSRSGIPTRRLRLVLEQLHRRYPDGQAAFAQLELFAGLLVLRDDESRLTAPDGQLLFDLAADHETTATVTLKPDVLSRGDDLFEQAVALEATGKSEEAARAYRESLLETGPELSACFNLANVLHGLGHTAAAAERYRQTLEIDPQFAPAWNNLGMRLSELREVDQALEAWRRALELDAELADALFNLADALQTQSRFDEAWPLWEAYLRLDGDGAWSDYARSCLDGVKR